MTVRRFFARVFAMHPRDILVGAAVLWVAIPIGVFAWIKVRNEGATERLIQRLVTEQANGLRKDLFGWLNTHVGPVTDALAKLPGDTKSLVDSHATRIENKVQTEFRHATDQTVGAAVMLGVNTLHVVDTRADDALKEVQGIRADLAPVVRSTTALEDRYARIPDDISRSRSWLDIRQEIECRKIDDFGIVRGGYGECVKGRVIGLLGEGIKVGGVITKHAEPMAQAVQKSANAFAGILEVLQRAASKYLDPHPKHWYDRVFGFVKFLGAVLIAALRGGAV